LSELVTVLHRDGLRGLIYADKRDISAFNPDARCAKCAGEDIGSAYCPTGRHFCEPKYHDVALIHRNCRRCGYSWPELPLDSPAVGGGDS